MSTHLPAALIALTLASSAFAASFNLPADKPTCSITFPDDWHPGAYQTPVDGVSGQTADARVFMCAECVDSKNIGSVMDQGMKWFKRNGVTVDLSTLKTDDKFIVNGIDGALFTWTGEDRAGPCIIQIAAMSTQADKGILVEYWASPSAEKQYAPAVTQIIQSLKPVPTP